VIGFDEAFALVCAEARPLGKEEVSLASAHRRTLAEPVVAMVDSPPVAVSAMDGYAIRETELEEGRTAFPVAGESFPGNPFHGTAAAGECVRIFTGAPLPAGFDRVVIQENVERDGEIATVVERSSGRHVRPQGSDFRAGDRLLEAGRLLGPGALVAAAGADLAGLAVWRQPRLALLGTGDELAEPGQARDTPGSIPESLTPGLSALAEIWGGTVIARYRLPDVPDAIRAAAAEALRVADLLVVTGGASVGEKDYAKAVLASLGLELIFPKVAIKPGKPVWFGRVGDRLVMGLPGNPTSAMVTARLLLAPLIAGLGGRDPREAARWSERPLSNDLAATGDRECFARARLLGDAIEILGDQNSGSQRALSQAEFLVRRRAGAAGAGAGERVEVLAF
jgi:molybdopterin molybdotransferase